MILAKHKYGLHSAESMLNQAAAEMNQAAEIGQVDMLYELLAKNPNLLEHLDNAAAIVETPLHVAAKVGQTHFAMELLTLKPLLAQKLNQDGLSPMHLALQNRHMETVRGFVSVDSKLVQVKGKDRITPLHFVAKIGDFELLEEFLGCCPSAILDLTVRRKTVIHLAVENKNLQAFKFLFGWLHRQNMEHILDWKDEEGNTVLHIACHENEPKVVELLINNVDIHVKNNDNKTAIDIFKNNNESSSEDGEAIKEILSRASVFSSLLNSLIRKRDDLIGVRVRSPEQGHQDTVDVRNVILVVAVLIATATYQAVLSPPGGYWQDNYTPPAKDNTTVDPGEDQMSHKAGKLIMSAFETSYFSLLNTSAFCASVCTIVVLVMGLPFSFFLEASTLFISCSYFVSLITIFSSLDATTLCLLFLLGLILGFVHLVAFEAHRRKQIKSRVGRYQWKYKSGPLPDSVHESGT